MSVVVCTVETNIIRMLSDTQVTQGSFRRTVCGTKLFITPSAVVGFAGAACYARILRQVLKDNPLTSHDDDELFEFIDNLNEQSQKRGLNYTNDDTNAIQIILASKNRVTTILGYTIIDVETSEAIGSECDLAYGLLGAGMRDIDVVEAVCKQSILCSAPYEVIEISRDTGTIVGDILDENRKALSSFTATIDYAEKIDMEEERFFNSNPEFDINVINVSSNRRLLEDDSPDEELRGHLIL